ncbi:MAG: light-harvesting antenna LH1, beta subunit [Pseudomonadota bacterium]
MADEKVNITGLTDEQAKELHNGFVQVAVAFTGIAVVAHVFVWLWRPWIPGV